MRSSACLKSDAVLQCRLQCRRAILSRKACRLLEMNGGTEPWNFFLERKISAFVNQGVPQAGGNQLFAVDYRSAASG